MFYGLYQKALRGEYVEKVNDAVKKLEEKDFP